MTRAGKLRVANAALLAGSLILAVVLCEAVLRIRYSDPAYTPRPEVKTIQSHLQVHPELGFTWKPCIKAGEGLVFHVADVEYDALSTDEFGFWNPPEAIADRTNGEPVDVVGLGDSFMEHAAYEFRALFAQRGLSYYSMAMHRQCPPQYNEILETYTLPLHPKWVVYGLFENDFEEMEDYERWRASGLDWFAFHSGTWCGPPLSINPIERFFKRHFRGMGGFARVLRERFGSANETPPPVDVDNQASKTLEYILRARDAAESKGAQFLVVVIPSRELATQGASKAGRVLDKLATQLAPVGVRMLDLRKPFAENIDPFSLYYTQDAHWNRNGIREAGRRILDAIGE